MTEDHTFMNNMLPALRKEKQLEVEGLTAVLKFDGPVYMIGDSITEAWDGRGMTVTRTYMGDDGEIRTENIDPKDFYAD